MKKTVFVVLLVVMLLGAVSATAFAYGGFGVVNGVAAQPAYELCTVDGCDVVGMHQHDDVWYCNPMVGCGRMSGGGGHCGGGWQR